MVDVREEDGIRSEQLQAEKDAPLIKCSLPGGTTTRIRRFHARAVAVMKGNVQYSDTANQIVRRITMNDTEVNTTSHFGRYYFPLIFHVPPPTTGAYHTESPDPIAIEITKACLAHIDPGKPKTKPLAKEFNVPYQRLLAWINGRSPRASRKSPTKGLDNEQECAIERCIFQRHTLGLPPTTPLVDPVARGILR